MALWLNERGYRAVALQGGLRAAVAAGFHSTAPTVTYRPGVPPPMLSRPSHAPLLSTPSPMPGVQPPAVQMQPPVAPPVPSAGVSPQSPMGMPSPIPAVVH